MSILDYYLEYALVCIVKMFSFFIAITEAYEMQFLGTGSQEA